MAPLPFIVDDGLQVTYLSSQLELRPPSEGGAFLIWSATSGRKDLNARRVCAPSIDAVIRAPPTRRDQFFMPVMEALIARGSRCGQRPVSTCAMNSPTMRLYSSGSSMLIAWPEFGITESAAEGMLC